MEIDKHAGMVRVWWGQPDGHDRWSTDDDETVENEPDLVMADTQANALVMELLRGPMGPVGPMGARGLKGDPGTIDKIGRS